MTKKQRALEIIERLKKEYPDAGCTLDYDQAWKLLVSVRLAAQCTDARVNIVVEKIYEKFPDVDALADAPVEEIEAIVKPCGLGHSKARDISAVSYTHLDVYKRQIQSGKISEESGSFDESGAAYLYQYQYVTNINKIDDFYVIAEIYRGEDGTDTKTGNLFAVNAYNQELYKLQVDESGRRYTLVAVSDI